MFFYMVQSGKEKRENRLTPVSESKTRERARQFWYSAKLQMEISDVSALSMLKHEHDPKTRSYLFGAAATLIHQMQHLDKITSILAGFANSPNEEERHAAVSAVAKYLQQYEGNATYIRILSDALQDSSQRISTAASRGLQDYAAQSNQNATAVLAVVPAESEVANIVRRSCSRSMLPPEPANGGMKIQDLKSHINALSSSDEKKRYKANLELERYMSGGSDNARRIAGLILIAGKSEDTDAIYQKCLNLIKNPDSSHP